MAKFYLTTPIYYVNDAPHIGSAYATLATDVLARAHRQLGDEVRFITGTDEHGTKIAQEALKAGLEPKIFADQIAAQFQKTWELLDIKPDAFVRTTDPQHEYLVGQVMSRLHEQGYIYPGQYEGWYCVPCEEYKDVSKDEVSPNSGSAQPPLCEIHQKPLEFVQEQIYFFKLSEFQNRLIEVIESQEFKIEPMSRRNEVLSFLKTEPTRDAPVTRSKVPWGIPVPFDKTQTVYVWFDALLIYLSASGENVDLTAIEGRQTWWPAALQLVGKDILRFHAVIWPAMLMALNLPLPKELFAHGFFTMNGAKMSKTTGNVISPQQLIDRYGVDATRYLILAAVPLGADGDISLDRMDAQYTADLANGLGNLLQRTIVLINKFGVKPQVEPGQITKINEAYQRNDLTKALGLITQLIADANRYLAEEQPWSMENDALRETVLAKVYEELLKIAEGLAPVMPSTSVKIRQQLESLVAEPLFPRLADEHPPVLGLSRTNKN